MSLYNWNLRGRRGIRGTHLQASIQDIVDEVAPIKKGHLMGLRADSFKCDVTRLIRGLRLYFRTQIAQK